MYRSPKGNIKYTARIAQEKQMCYIREDGVDIP